MILAGIVFVMAAISGFAAVRLGQARRGGAPASPGLARLAFILAYAWLTLSALLFAWATYRLTR
jgi:hypothetical protein